MVAARGEAVGEAWWSLEGGRRRQCSDSDLQVVGKVQGLMGVEEEGMVSQECSEEVVDDTQRLGFGFGSVLAVCKCIRESALVLEGCKCTPG